MLHVLKCFKQEYLSIFILVEIQSALHEPLHEEKESRIRSKKRNITV